MCVCLGVSRGASNIDTLTESRAILPGILRNQETIRVHLRYSTWHRRRSFLRVKERTGIQIYMSSHNSELHFFLPPLFESASLPQSPPQLLSTIPISLEILEIVKKFSCIRSILRQNTVDWTDEYYFSRVHLFRERLSQYMFFPTAANSMENLAK